MQKYPVRASHRAGLTPERLKGLAAAEFGSARTEGEKVSAAFGALGRLTVWAAGRELAVEVEMLPRVADDVARETIARYNRFLEQATGFSSKERARRLRKSATAADAGS